MPVCIYCVTVIDMANVLNTEKQIAVISALAEGSSIRSIERITGINRNTIMNLGVRIGQGCAGILDEKMRGLTLAVEAANDKRTQQVTVLQIPPSTTPDNAVRAAIVAQHRHG